MNELAALADRELAHAPVGDVTLYPLLVARGIAGGIDAVHGDAFVDWFRSQIEFAIKEDAAYVTSVRDPRPFMGDQRVNSRSELAPSRSLDSVPHLSLGDATSTSYRFVLDFDMHFHLAPLAGSDGGIGLAAAQPNLSIGEFDVEWMDGPPRTFRNRGAKDSERQADLVIGTVETAARAGASVIVVPEYCLSGDQRLRVAAAIDALEPRPALVVAGTCEIADPAAGGNRNEAWIYVPDEPDLSYGRAVELPAVELAAADGQAVPADPKHGRGVTASKVYPAEVGGYVEAVVSAVEVPVFYTESITFAVLICRDAMSNELVGALARMGVNLLLVPAFSPKTGTIIGNAATLATQSQAFVVVACAPAFWQVEDGDELAMRDGTGRVEAAFDGPYDNQPGPTNCPSPAAPASGRGTWVFDTALRSVRWAPIQ